jgi:hypothetical protein
MLAVSLLREQEFALQGRGYYRKICVQTVSLQQEQDFASKVVGPSVESTNRLRCFTPALAGV